MENYKTGFYINEQGKLVDLIIWSPSNYYEYEVIGIYKGSSDYIFTYNIRKEWED